MEYLKSLVKLKFCIYMAAVVVLPLFFNTNVNAEKPLPGLNLEQTQQYYEKINTLIELYGYTPYDSDEYKIPQTQAINSIENIIILRNLLNLPNHDHNDIARTLKLNYFPDSCIKTVISLYNLPAVTEESAFKLCQKFPSIRKLLENLDKIIPGAEDAINCAKRALEVQYRDLLCIASDGEIDLNSDL